LLRGKKKKGRESKKGNRGGGKRKGGGTLGKVSEIKHPIDERRDPQENGRSEN